MRMIVGLGNPGEQYRLTRHNIGFMVVDKIAEEKNLGDFINDKKLKAEIIKSGELILAKPQTYMNLSGESVIYILNYYKVLPQNLIVIHDDIDLPFGEIRVRNGGKSGGHNGLNSIMQLLGTEEFGRIRIGVGRSEIIKPEDFVLSNFTSEEEKDLNKIIDAAVRLTEEGLECDSLDNQSIFVL